MKGKNDTKLHAYIPNNKHQDIKQELSQKCMLKSMELFAISYEESIQTIDMCYFSSLIINFKASFPFAVSSYVVDGGLSADTLLEISPAVSSSISRLASVRLLIFGVNNSSSSLYLLGSFRSSKRISLLPFLASNFSNLRPCLTHSIKAETFIYLVNVCHLVTKKSLSDTPMPREYLLKYPELISYYRKKGYRVETDADLRDVHAWIPLELYSKLMAKSSICFSQERGRISKAVAEALEKWLLERENDGEK